VYPRISDLLKDLFGITPPVDVYSFGLLVGLAIGLACWIGMLELDRLYRAGRLSGVRMPKENGRGTEVASPAVLIGHISLLALATGIVGAKLFHIMEYPDAFLMRPRQTLFSGEGLTFYGGLIVAGITIAAYVKRKGLSVPRVADVAAPGLMIAYGVGRVGCYLAGDGDWGVCSSLADKPSWIPAWLWSETFPNSILDPRNQTTQDALRVENCPPSADGVYPTMLYEAAMAFVLFGVLWALRKHPYRGGWLFSLYLLFSGAERFLIEQIRVNVTGSYFGFEATQAEAIALLSVILGVAGLVYTSRRVGAASSPRGQEATW